MTDVGSVYGSALYTLLRGLYRRCGGNEDFFAVTVADFDGGIVDADMTLRRTAYLRALNSCENLPALSSDDLTGCPGLGQSAAQVLHSADERANHHMED